MLTTTEQLPQYFNEDPLLLVFDNLYARITERAALTLNPDERQEKDAAVLGLLAALLLASERPHATTDGQRYLEQGHLVLNPDGNIESFSISIPNLLGYPTIRLAERPFSSLLTETSANSWEGLLAVLQGRICFHTVTALTLLTLYQQPITALCSISKLLNSKQLHVSCLFAVQELSTGQIHLPNKSSRSDAILLQQLHDLILEHLDRPLPSIPQLAKQLGTNTFTLKDGFKHYFNMGIYQFYTQERLAKAKLMLLETDLPLPAIAEACGYGSASTFSKAFKKKYGMAPLPFKKTR